MTPDAAAAQAKRLNESGKHREHWHYYPTMHENQNEWFVMRRPFDATIRVAVFINGEVSGSEL